MSATKRIVVDRRNIAANKDRAPEERFMVVRVYCRDASYTGMAVRIEGDSNVVYNPEAPTVCGASVWIETEGDVFVTGRDGGRVLVS